MRDLQFGQEFRGARVVAGGKAQLDGALGGSADGEREQPVVVDASDDHHARAAEVGQREPAERRAGPQRMGRDVQRADQFPGRQGVAAVARDKFRHRLAAHGPAGAVDLGDGVQRRAQGNDRPGRQRGGDVAAHRRQVPDLERGDKRVAGGPHQLQRVPVARQRGVLGQGVELGDGAGRGEFDAVFAHGDRLPPRGGDVQQPGQRLGSVGKEHGAAGEPGVAVAVVVRVGGGDHRLDGVHVHAGTSCVMAWPAAAGTARGRRVWMDPDWVLSGLMVACAERAAMISAAMLIATSAAVPACRSSPIGECSRASSCSGTRSARRAVMRASWLLREPMAPM